MPLGSTNIERSRRAIFKTALASTPRKPLLFLYPRFFGTASIPQSVKQDTDSILKESDAPVKSNSTSDKSLDNGVSSGSVLSGSMAITATDSNDFPKAIKNMLVQNTTSEVVIRRILQCKETQKSLEEYKQKTKQMYRAKLRALSGLSDETVDVRTILQTLNRYTPAGPKFDGVEVTIPKAAVHSLLFDVDESIWKIRVRTSCNIQLLNEDVTKPQTRTLLLSGLPDQISRAWEELWRIVPNCTPSSFNTPGAAIDHSYSTSHVNPQKNLLIGGEAPALVRVVPSENWKIMARDFNDIKEPSKWTKSTFEYHVLCLIHSRNQRPGERYDRVRDRLISLFENSKFAGVFSASAINLTMAYFTKTSQLKEARRLFVRMESMGAVMETETFNIMLRAAAKVHDLYNFRFLLGMMVKRGLLPDAGTWLAFLKAVPNFSAQAPIVASMQKKGMLAQMWVVQDLLRTLGPLETQWSILRGDSHDNFIEYMDKRYGTQWLSTSSANRILKHLALHGLFPRCFSLVLFMHSRMVEPDGVSSRTIIGHCRHQVNFTAAIHTIGLFSTLRVGLSEGTFEELFSMTLDNRMYWLMRVVWLYACFNNATTFRMRKQYDDMVFTSWSQSHDWNKVLTAGVFSGQEIWRRTAGKLAINSAFAQRLLEKTEPSLVDKHQPKTNRPVRRQIGRKQIGFELSIYQDYMPGISFHQALEQAYMQDLEWNREKIWYKKSLRWMLSNFIKIPVIPRDATKMKDKKQILEWL